MPQGVARAKLRCRRRLGSFLSKPFICFATLSDIVRKKPMTIVSPAAMAKLAIDRACIVACKKKSGDFHSKSGDREIFIISSKIGRSPAKSGDLEALETAYK